MQQNQTTQSNPGQVLGIIGLVLGILAAIVSFIPCFGIYAIFPGIAGIVLSAISMSQSVKVNAPKGLAIAGLICAIVGTGIAGYQWFVLKKAANEITKSYGDLEKAGKDYEEMDRKLDRLNDNYNGGGYSTPDASDYNQAIEDASNQYNNAYDDAQQQYNDAYDDAQQQYNDAMQDAQNQIDNMDLNP